MKLVTTAPLEEESRVDDSPDKINDQAALETYLSQSMEEPLSGMGISRLEPRSVNINLND